MAASDPQHMDLATQGVVPRPRCLRERNGWSGQGGIPSGELSPVPEGILRLPGPVTKGPIRRKPCPSSVRALRRVRMVPRRVTRAGPVALARTAIGQTSRALAARRVPAQVTTRGRATPAWTRAGMMPNPMQMF